MANPTAPFPMTLSDLQGHSPIVSLFRTVISNWQDFKWQNASLGLSATAELLVEKLDSKLEVT